MDCNLQGLRMSKQWRKNLRGYITLDDGSDLSDREVRIVVEQGILHGYKTVMQIPETEARKWINDATK